MTSQIGSSFWAELRLHASETVKSAFRAVPPRFLLAAALFLPLALLAWACRFCFAWAADHYFAAMPASDWSGVVRDLQNPAYEAALAPLGGQVPQKA